MALDKTTIICYYNNSDGEILNLCRTEYITSGYGAGLYHVKMIGGKFDSFNQLS